jgi:sulfatase maturation enzyme AslB (radical SAM superfamily)
MRDEAVITVNGTKLTNNESRVVRLALPTFADIMANQLKIKDASIPLTERYQTDTAHILALIEGRALRTQ